MLRLGQGECRALSEGPAEELSCRRNPVSRVGAAELSLHYLYEEEADVSAVVCLDPDEPGEGRVYRHPLLVFGHLAGSGVLRDEVGGVGMSIDDEKTGRSEPVVELAAVNVPVHRLDEEGEDVSAAVGVVSYELWDVHWLGLPEIEYMFCM